jgi:hypothetical protein
VIKFRRMKWVGCVHAVHFFLLLFFLIFLMPFLRRRNFFFTYGSLRHLVGLLGRGISSAPRPLPTHRTTQHRETLTHIHAPSRIRTSDPNVRAAEDSTWLRPRGYWDRLHAVHIGQKSEGKRQLGRLRCRRENKIKLDVKDIWCEGVEAIQLAENKVQWRVLLNAVMKTPSFIKAGNFFTSWATIDFSISTMRHGFSYSFNLLWDIQDLPFRLTTEWCVCVCVCVWALQNLSICMIPIAF